jgi:hypothetical protein
VGETRVRPEEPPSIIINATNFDATNLLNRPKGWKELIRSRVMVKEQYEKLSGVNEADLIKSRPKKESDVSLYECRVFNCHK